MPLSHDPHKVIPLAPARQRSRLYRETLSALLQREIDTHNRAANHRELGRRDPAIRALCLGTVQRLTEALDLCGADWVADQEIGTPFDPAEVAA